jgi:hypothetical protein
MPSDDRDPKFERALAQHLRGGSAQANCPDAETLAAYHERNLSLEEMAQWKQHISACEACQEALALVETTENQLAEDWKERGIPVLEAASMQGAHAGSIPKSSAREAASAAPLAAPAPVEILRRRRPALLRWAIPLGAVAAGVLIFIGVYEQRASKVAHYADTIVARRQAPAEPPPVLDQRAAKAHPPAESKDVQALTAEMSRLQKEKEPSAAPSAKPAEQTRTADDELRKTVHDLAVSRGEIKKPAPPAPSAPNHPMQASTDAAVSENAPVIAAVPRPASPPAQMTYGGSAGGVAAQRPPARADEKSAPSSVTETVTVESQAAPLNGRMMTKQGVSNELVEVTAAEAGLILTPDNKVFWKLQPAGTLQLTTDGGKKWKSLDSGANANLTAGFAPSSRVCWLAGKAGILLLTTDRGAHWTRVTTPITGDLGGVHASDAKHASIWDAASHVSYETSDGGASWKQTSSK